MDVRAVRTRGGPPGAGQGKLQGAPCAETHTAAAHSVYICLRVCYSPIDYLPAELLGKESFPFASGLGTGENDGTRC